MIPNQVVCHHSPLSHLPHSKGTLWAHPSWTSNRKWLIQSPRQPWMGGTIQRPEIPSRCGVTREIRVGRKVMKSKDLAQSYSVFISPPVIITAAPPISAAVETTTAAPFGASSQIIAEVLLEEAGHVWYHSPSCVMLWAWEEEGGDMVVLAVARGRRRRRRVIMKPGSMTKGKGKWGSTGRGGERSWDAYISAEHRLKSGCWGQTNYSEIKIKPQSSPCENSKLSWCWTMNE